MLKFVDGGKPFNIYLKLSKTSKFMPQIKNKSFCYVL